MARGLFETICVAAFTAPVAAACLHAWPLVTGRPLPTGMDTEAGILAALSLVFSAGLTMLMSASIQSNYRRR
ncbi:hypothetical protein J2W80_004340 [Methylorubrum extorquens]|nr:hypothetical protein [Methylorubrum extorquens]MCP1588124.1 hypothetical protein [Methylorubrum extorquens]